MTTMDRLTTSSKLDAAVTAGRRIAAIRSDPTLWALSREAWDKQALALGEFSCGVGEAWRKLNDYQALRGAIETRAQLWVNTAQPEPALYQFGGERDLAAHVERLASGLSLAACSALAALRCGEMRDPASWGQASALGEAATALEPHLAALRELDAALHRTVGVRDLSWRGGQAFLEHRGLVLELDAATARAIASSFAELAGSMPVALAAA